MISLIEDNRDAIVALCERYGVQRLAIFGSAVKGTFNPAASDLDFVLEFTEYSQGVARRFISFADSPEALLGRSVDLVFESKLKNPYFRKEVLATMEVIFDGSGGKTAAA